MTEKTQVLIIASVFALAMASLFRRWIMEGKPEASNPKVTVEPPLRTRLIAEVGEVQMLRPGVWNVTLAGANTWITVYEQETKGQTPLPGDILVIEQPKVLEFHRGEEQDS